VRCIGEKSKPECRLDFRLEQEEKCFYENLLLKAENKNEHRNCLELNDNKNATWVGCWWLTPESLLLRRQRSGGSWFEARWGK
jgi:hypothetical protein